MSVPSTIQLCNYYSYTALPSSFCDQYNSLQIQNATTLCIRQCLFLPLFNSVMVLTTASPLPWLLYTIVCVTTLPNTYLLPHVDTSCLGRGFGGGINFAEVSLVCTVQRQI